MMDGGLLGSDVRLRMGFSPDFQGIGADLYVNRRGDVDTVAGRDNLGQAIVHRLMTRQGELEELGHPEYGSRLHELIGEPNNADTRKLVRIYANQCLAQEVRIEKVESIDVLEYGGDPHSVLMQIAVVPIGSSVPISVSMPYRLEVGS
jgi:phage baseplate assembly protein W